MAFSRLYDPGTAYLLGQVGGAGWVVGTSTGPASYASTSFPVAATSLGLSVIYFAEVTCDNAAYKPHYDYDSNRINVYTNSGANATSIGVEVADAADLSEVTFRLAAFGPFND